MLIDAQVRAATRGDASDIARVHLDSWRWAYSGVLPEAYLRNMRHDELAARWWLRLSNPEIDEQVTVLEQRGRVRAFVTFGPFRDDPSWLGHAGEVYMLYVDPSETGQGLGTELLDGALDELARCRCHWAVVWVLAKNERARAFYESAGMRLDGGRRWDPFGDRVVPVVRYAKALNPVFDFDSLRTPSAGAREAR